MKFRKTITAFSIAAICAIPACSDGDNVLKPSEQPSSQREPVCDFKKLGLQEVSFFDQDVMLYANTSNFSPTVRCIPGEGEYEFGLPDQINALGASSEKDLKVISWQVARDDQGWYGLVFAKVHTQSSGLNPGADTMKIATVNLEDGKVDKVHELGENFVGISIGKNRVIAAGTKEDASVLVGVDMKSGQEVWRREGAFGVSDSTTVPAIGNSVTYTQNVGSSTNRLGFGVNCYEVGNLDIQTGTVRWAYNSQSPELSPKTDQKPNCGEVKRAESFGPSYVIVTTNAEPGNALAAAENRRNYVQSLDNPNNRLSDSFINYSVSRSKDIELRDPVSDLSVMDVEYRMDSSKEPLGIIDRKSGQVVYQLTPEQANKLGAKVRSIFDGKLYIENADGKTVVDARTGAATGERWDVYPVGRMNGYNIYNDGSIKSAL